MQRSGKLLMNARNGSDGSGGGGGVAQDPQLSAESKHLERLLMGSAQPPPPQEHEQVMNGLGTCALWFVWIYTHLVSLELRTLTVTGTEAAASRGKARDRMYPVLRLETVLYF